MCRLAHQAFLLFDHLQTIALYFVFLHHDLDVSASGCITVLDYHGCSLDVLLSVVIQLVLLIPTVYTSVDLELCILVNLHLI